jgi:glycosyltransferase involved in cell wall biosynthesis
VRAALVGPYPLGLAHFRGGVDTSFANLIEGLRNAADTELHVLTLVPGLREASCATAEGVVVHYLPGHTRLNNVTRYAGNRRTLQRALHDVQPDVIHAQDALGYGYTCLKTRSVAPVVVSIHGLVRETRKHVPQMSERIRATSGAAIEHYCVRHADFLVGPTMYPARYFGSEIRGKYFAIDNPISDRFFSVDPAPQPGRIIFSGAVIPLKRLVDLVDAIAILTKAVANVQLRIAGPLSDHGYATVLRSHAEAMGVADRVVLLDVLSPGELVEEYRRAALLVLPSAQETSPMVIGEAMAVGLPVVATRVGGVAELVTDGRTGFLVTPGDVVALATRIKDVLLDDARRNAFGKAGREEADRRFRAGPVAARVRDVYAEAVATQAR